MADTKLVDLTALTTPSGDDILYIVDDPAGTPLDRKIALNNLFTRGTITASAPVLDASQTWNNAAVTFTGLKFNVVSDTSATASLLMDLQVGGASVFFHRKSGAAYGPLGTAAAVSYGATANVGTGLFFPSATNLGFSVNGTSQFNISTTSLSAPSTSIFGFCVGAIGSSIDTILTRRGAANLRFGAADVGATTATVTITIAAPGVVTWSGHTLSTGTPVVFTTTGALPTGIVSGTTYYAVVVDANTFQIASSVANAIAATPTVITTSGSQSGTHTGTRYNITQRLSMQSITGVTDRLGANLFIQGSQGTGTGAGGSIIFQVAPAGSTGSAQNALATALTITSAQRVQAASWVDSVNGYTVNSGSADVIIGAAGSYGVTLRSTTFLAWTNADATATQDVFLRRDAANTLALRNGANAQEMRVYETTTGTIYKAILGNRQLIKIAGAAFDNGAGASAGTLTNAPAVGNPTKWIPIDDNGTTRHIPAW